MMKRYSVFRIEQKMEFGKFNSFLIDFLRFSFVKMKIISTVVEREYTPDITWQICLTCQFTGFYMTRGFIERYFLTDYIYILENHFYFVNVPDYCFKPSLSWILNSYIPNGRDSDQTCFYCQLLFWLNNVRKIVNTYLHCLIFILTDKA